MFENMGTFGFGIFAVLFEQNISLYTAYFFSVNSFPCEFSA